jgi:hypothetical protein
LSTELRIAIRAQDEASAKLREVSRNLEQVGQSSRQVAESVQRSQLSFRDLSNQITGTAQSFMRLYSLYDNIQNAQLRLAQANNRLEDTQIRLQKAQEAYNKAVAEYGTNSSQAASAMVTVQQIQADLAINTERAQQAQENVTKAWIQAGTQAIPSLITAGASLQTLLSGLVGVKGTLATTTGAASGAMNTFTGSMVAAEGAATGLKVTLGTLLPVIGGVAAVVGTAVVSWTQVHVPFQKMVEGANLTAREYMALMRAVSESGLSIDEFGKKLIAGEIQVSEYGEVAVEAANKVLEAYKRLKETTVTPPATTTQTPTTSILPKTADLETYQKQLKEAREALHLLREQYLAGGLDAESYADAEKILLGQIEALEKKINFIKGTAKGASDSFDDLTTSLKRTGTTKEHLERNFGTLGGAITDTISLGGNLGGVFQNLGQSFQFASSMLGQFGATQQMVLAAMGRMGGFSVPNVSIPGIGGMPQVVSGGQWQALGSWATGAMQTAAGINPQGMIATAGQAVAPMLQAMQLGGSLQQWSQQALGVGAQTAQQMLGAMGGMANIPIVSQMLQGAGDMGLPAPVITPPPPSPATDVFGSIGQTLGNIGNSIVSTLTNVGSTISNVISSIVPSTPPPVYYPPPPVPDVAMQEGGIVTRPVRALLGEGYRKEAVIPLDKLSKERMANTFNVTMHVQSLSMGDKADLRRFWSELEENLSRAVRRKG